MNQSNSKTIEQESNKQAFAVTRGVHISARKTRLVADLIRGKSAAEAVLILQALRKRAAHPVLKTLLSAVSNAEHNHKLDKNRLVISEIRIDQGSTFRRFRAAARGRVKAFKKPTSHISITLSEKESRQSSRGLSFPTIIKRTKSRTVKHDHEHGHGEIKSTEEEKQREQVAEAAKKIMKEAEKKEQEKGKKGKGKLSNIKNIIRKTGEK